MKNVCWRQNETIGHYLKRMGIKPDKNWTCAQIQDAIDRARKIEYRDCGNRAIAYEGTRE